MTDTKLQVEKVKRITETLELQVALTSDDINGHKTASGESKKDYRNTRALSSSHFRWHNFCQLTIFWPAIRTEDQAPTSGF